MSWLPGLPAGACGSPGRGGAQAGYMFRVPRSVFRIPGLLLLVMLTACGEDPVPRPRGHLRLDLPDTGYVRWSGACPFDADLPVYALGVDRPGQTAATADTACASTLRFPGQRASVFITCRRLNGDLAELIEDAHAFKAKHEARAVRIRTERLERPDARVFGTLFNVDGDVASPLVLYLTDSTSRFLYASLYFDARPNGDSLEPVTARLRADLHRFAGSLTWR